MRIAVTGTHGTGKTTLIEEFVSTARAYEAVPEPYWLLTQEGMAFANGPNIADLEEQLACSCALIAEQITGDNVVFDRCPLDLVAYLEVVSASEGFEWSPQGRMLGRMEKALQSLDMIVFVPLQKPDEISIKIEYPKLRQMVDRRLKAIMRKDDLGLLEAGPRILEVSGPTASRVRQLVAALG